MLKVANFFPNRQIFPKAISAYIITLDGLQQYDKFENNEQLERTIKNCSNTGTFIQTLTHFNFENEVLIS